MEKEEGYKIVRVKRHYPSTIPITISLSREQLAELDKLVERTGISRSAFVRIKLGIEDVGEVLREVVENAYK